MKVIGIIAEYNPFHLGHLYQINKIKEKFPDALIVAIISTNFTQRGDISIIDKWEKTEIALSNGVDLVLELPTLYATQSADIFAYGAIDILQKFKIDTLVFGSECDNVKTLLNMANTQLNNPEYDILVKKYLSKGVNYPTALNKALVELNIPSVSKPNDLLGLSYIKEIIRNNYSIKPITIKRTNDYHADKVTSNIINASLIRKLILMDKDVSEYVPENVNNYLSKKITLQDAYSLLIYKIINNRDNLDEYLDVDEGIENRLLDKLIGSNTWDELIMNIKTKRYTYNKINRMFLHILLNIRKRDNNKETYLRILGFNDKGRRYLNQVKKEITDPIYTHYKPNQNATLDIEFYSTWVYAIVTNNPSLIEKEYQKNPIIYK